VEREQLDQIIINKVTGQLSKEEQLVFDEWIAQSGENKKEFEAYSTLWTKSEALVLSESINLESSLIQTKKKLFKRTSTKRWIVYLRQAAAVFILSLALAWVYHYLISPKELAQIPEQRIYQEIKAASGTQTRVNLADGTCVWLNSGSTLRFPTSFGDSEKREVELNGEGYFDVTKNESKPFIIHTSKLSVKVYGTSLNVFAYDDYEDMTVALVDGKVSLVRKCEDKEKEIITLNPDEVIEYNTGTKKLYHSTDNHMEKYTAWKDGYIVFYGDEIDYVVKRLEKWYNVEITIADKAIQNYHFTATFIDESLEQVLKLLSWSSPIQYKITPAQKQEDNSFSKRKIILSKKTR
jgi:ferric-dicitrate binding protein FerR (iron transport regulator)